MTTPTLWLAALPMVLSLGLVAWAIASARRNAGLVDIFWSLFFLVAAVVYASLAPAPGVRAQVVLALVAIWSLRLAGHLARRNWNDREDHRYQAIRARHEPGFVWKSLYLVFGLQALLAWLISAPIAASIGAADGFGPLETAGATLAAFGILFEWIADAQLARFRSEPGEASRVLDRGLWRYTRHPNYFGECCVWWGFYAVALGAGAWWTVFAPLVMTVLLLKISGVALLERDIAARRPAYRDYAARTNAFLPGPPRAK